MNAYFPGAVVKLAASFLFQGVATDPTAVGITVRTPSGTETAYTAVRDSAGQYHYLLDLSSAAPGTWFYRWTGTGAAQAAQEAAFWVMPSNF